MSGKRSKNDAADAAAICEAVTRPNMRFVPVKSISQLFVHRARQGYVQQRTALINRIRGLLCLSWASCCPSKPPPCAREAHKHLEDLPGWCNTVVGDMLSELTHLDTRITQYDKYITQTAKEDTQASQLMRLGGVGPTTASAIVATVGKGHDFTCGRQFCAWLGWVPGQ
jgi:transposase